VLERPAKKSSRSHCEAQSLSSCELESDCDRLSQHKESCERNVLHTWLLLSVMDFPNCMPAHSVLI